MPRAALTIRSGADRVTWFQSSEKVRRGFCSACGSALFWDPTHKDWLGVAMGSFDRPTDTRLGALRGAFTATPRRGAAWRTIPRWPKQ